MMISEYILECDQDVQTENQYDLHIDYIICRLCKFFSKKSELDVCLNKTDNN